MPHSPRRSLPLLLSALLVAVSLPACSLGSGPRSAPDSAQVITASQIQRTGARNALEALQRSGTHFQVGQTLEGQATHVMRRGHSSLVLGPAPMIYVDGARTSGLQALVEIPASAIARIRIYNGMEGTRFFGSGGGNGVIVVETRYGAAV